MSPLAIRNKLLDLLFYVIIGTAYAFALSTSVFTATILVVDPGRLLGMCALFILVFHLLFFNRYTALAVLGAALIGGVVVYLSLRSQDFTAPWFLEAKGMAGELYLFFQNQLPMKSAYNRISTTAIPLLLCLLTALNTRSPLGFYVLTLVGAVVYGVPVYMEWQTSRLALVLLLFSFLVLLARKLNLFAAPATARSASPSLYALGLIPLGALIFAIAWLLPKPEIAVAGERRPLDLQGMADSLIYDIAPSQTLSFSDDGSRLGGPIALNDRVVMEVESDEPLYLSGSVRNTYSGSAWTLNTQGETKLSADDTGRYDTTDYREDLFQIQRYYMRYYGRETKTVKVLTGDNRTKTIFTPAFRDHLWLSDEVGLNQNGGGAIQTAKPLVRQATYTQDYISWDYNNPYFVAILQNMAAGNGVAGLSSEELAPYLTLPDSLPQRVSDLAHQLTDGLPNNYDKLKALEQSLAQFPYTLEPDEVPLGQDFVDYFLFTGREGYCVYYASALAVMARCVDIPTRYVEGFVMPGERNANGGYTVTNAQAHAWVEAYFQGFGWVKFEATAPYYSGEAPAPPDSQAPEHQPDLQDNLPVPIPPVPPSQPEDTLDPGEQIAPAKRMPLPVVLLLALSGLTLVGFAAYRIIFSRYRAKQKQLGKLPNRQAVVVYFSRLIRAAGVYGYPMDPSETALVYAHRTAADLVFGDQALDLIQLAEIFSAASYSKNGVSDRERQLMRDCYYEMVGKLRHGGKGKLRYLLERYVLLRL